MRRKSGKQPQESMNHEGEAMSEQGNTHLETPNKPTAVAVDDGNAAAITEVETPNTSVAPHKVVVADQDKQDEEQHTWRETIKTSGNQLAAQIKRLIASGNVRRLTLFSADDRKLLEISVTVGVIGGAALVLILPKITALVAVAALVGHARLEVVRISKDAGEQEAVPAESAA